MKTIIFILIFIIYLLGNIYVFYRISTALPPNLYIRTALVLIGIFLSFSFVISSVWGDTLPIPITSFFYKVGASWMMILLYLVLAFLLGEIVYLINKVIPFTSEEALKEHFRATLPMLFTVGFITLLMIGGYIHYTKKARVHIPLTLNKNLNDSIIKKPLRIVAISDLHLGYTIGRDELDKWVTLINAENPDLVLIMGDLFDNSIRPVKQRQMEESLKKLNPSLGVYACLGNHEYIGGIAQDQKKLEFFEDANIRLLKDEYIEIDSTLYIVGRDDRMNTARKTLAQLLEGVDKTKPIILLDHQPYHLEEAEENGIDLQLSGHTHKGQVWPLSIITKMIYEIDYGLLKKGNTNVYVSSGIGIWGGKFRLGSQSEYVVIDIN